MLLIKTQSGDLVNMGQIKVLRIIKYKTEPNYLLEADNVTVAGSNDRALLAAIIDDIANTGRGLVDCQQVYYALTSTVAGRKAATVGGPHRLGSASFSDLFEHFALRHQVAISAVQDGTTRVSADGREVIFARHGGAHTLIKRTLAEPDMLLTTEELVLLRALLRAG